MSTNISKALDDLIAVAATLDNKLHAGFTVAELSAERSQLYNAINSAKAARATIRNDDQEYTAAQQQGTEGWTAEIIDCQFCGRHYEATPTEPLDDIKKALATTGRCFEDCPGNAEQDAADAEEETEAQRIERTISAEYTNDAIEDNISLVLADIRLLCDAKGLDFAVLDKEARDIYQQEKGEALKLEHPPLRTLSEANTFDVTAEDLEDINIERAGLKLPPLRLR